MATAYWRKRADVKARTRYWRDRAEADMDAVQDAATVRIDRIGKASLKAAQELTDEVEKIIGKYAKRFNMSREEAAAALKQPFDEDSRAYGYRMTRAEALRDAAQRKAEVLRGLMERETAEQRRYTAREAYRLAGERLAEQGAGISFSSPDVDGLLRAIGTRWAGGSYSQNIWANTQALAEKLESEITAAYLSGKSNRKIAQVITDRFGVGFRQAERLVRTETSYVCNRAEMLSYGDAGIEEYEFLTARDSRTCTMCAGMNGQRFKVKDAEVGVNMPPMHPWCRCTTVAVAEEEADESLQDAVNNSIITSFTSMNELDGHKTDMERKVFVDGEYIKPMPKHELQRIQKAFKRNGGLIVTGKESDEYLSRRGVQGITYDAKTIMITSNPTRATVFEELIHTGQFRLGLNDGSLENRLQCEIEAKEKLLKYAKAYRLTDAEIRETRKLLAQNEQDMLEYRRKEGR